MCKIRPCVCTYAFYGYILCIYMFSRSYVIIEIILHRGFSQAYFINTLSNHESIVAVFSCNYAPVYTYYEERAKMKYAKVLVIIWN